MYVKPIYRHPSDDDDDDHPRKAITGIVVGAALSVLLWGVMTGAVIYLLGLI
jgi:dolichyl-phosphate-mannose--protein O-mannosyl transferase